MQVGDAGEAGLAQDHRRLAGTHAGVAHRHQRLVARHLSQTRLQFVERDALRADAPGLSASSRRSMIPR